MKLQMKWVSWMSQESSFCHAVPLYTCSTLSSSFPSLMLSFLVFFLFLLFIHQLLPVFQMLTSSFFSFTTNSGFLTLSLSLSLSLSFSLPPSLSFPPSLSLPPSFGQVEILMKVTSCNPIYYLLQRKFTFNSDELKDCLISVTNCFYFSINGRRCELVS